MNRHAKAIGSDIGRLAEDAEALMLATADAAGDQVQAARKRLAAALEQGQDFYGKARKAALERAKAADTAVHENPYPAILIGVGIGALLGFLVGRRRESPAA